MIIQSSKPQGKDVVITISPKDNIGKYAPKITDIVLFTNKTVGFIIHKDGLNIIIRGVDNRSDVVSSSIIGQQLAYVNQRK